MIVILTEERSMRDALVPLITRYFPSLSEGIHWQIIHFQGKADLEKNFPHKMRGWSHLSPHFIILRDNDGGDCVALKARLHNRALTTSKPFHIRLVCQELESWLLGDLEAVEAAFPDSRATRYAETAKYRDPDKLSNPSQELAALTSIRGKTSKAQAIAPHLLISRNRSNSFQLVIKTLRDLLPISAFQAESTAT